MRQTYDKLNPENAFIWRIVHRDNIEWILDNGLHCGNSTTSYDKWVHIGNPDLTDRRSKHPVPVGPNGYLNDYVPFYFTPFSPMMLNIHSGRQGVAKRSNDEIIILVSSLHRLKQLEVNFVYTDSHAYSKCTEFYTDLNDLDKIDWPLLQSRDFARDNNDLRKVERYQAEALIHDNLPFSALQGMVCYTQDIKENLDKQLKNRDMRSDIHAIKGWYF